jgi:hypothetical protein
MFARRRAPANRRAATGSPTHHPDMTSQTHGVIAPRLFASLCSSSIGMLATAVFYACAQLLPASALGVACVAAFATSITGGRAGALPGLSPKPHRHTAFTVTALAYATCAASSFFAGVALIAR